MGDSSDSSDNSVVHPKEVETVMCIHTVYTVRRYVQTLSLRSCVTITLQINAVFRAGLVN